MLTERELLSAIAECEREPITNGKVSRLADLYIIQEHLFGQPFPDYAYSNRVENDIIETSGDTEFLNAVNGKDAEKVWQIVGELAEAVKILHPRMYDSIIEKLSDI